MCCTFLFLFCLYALWLPSPLMVSSFLGQYQEVLSHGQVCFSVTVGVLATWTEWSVERGASSPLLQTEFRPQAKLTFPLVQQLLFFNITLPVASIDPKDVENLLR